REKFQAELRRRGDERARRFEFAPPRMALAIVGRELRNEETRQKLVSVLSDEAQKRIKSLGPVQQQMLLFRWIRDALQPKWGPGELEKFFLSDELTNTQREQLLN